MSLEVRLEADSRTGQAYGQARAKELYYCTFGLNPRYYAQLQTDGLHIVGVDQKGEARIVEVPQHPFFVGTLFVPQLTSTREHPHPLIVAYVEAALQFHIVCRGEKVTLSAG